ncbi:asparagine synthase (glutamine-hydrolyzing) [Faecalibacter macacae]|uniref:asparagine synthase (glutamine-hydrolyzing) n=1 Tax=Faecalibacter macacae TaxID=1859289 RepID=A0A3L9MAL5_9FLAO|nr:asparagine synthase (glutamine-hydrolyzing) [Faecalibacter macacae]RLZ08294.1 asparagine synthase (glutamine-hydrolyzing) [Faecalibacter macacae]
MCGISGVFSKSNLTQDHIINSLAAIKHRGPDNTIHTSYLNQDLQFYSSNLSNDITRKTLNNAENSTSTNWIGFNRLSIIDLSENGMQPFYDKETKVSFFMNGEIYNFKSLRHEFLNDVELKSNSDSEIAFQLYLKLGDDFIHHLRGMFVITIVDYDKEIVNIWRDRFGIKPLYYYLSDDLFIFSSEIKGVFASGLIDKNINYEHLAHSIYLNTNFAPNTIYENIYSLEAATKIEVNFKNFSLKKDHYWSLEYNPDPREISDNEFLNDINEIVELAAISDVKQAVMISGGLDSGLLAYTLGKHHTDIDAITIYNSLNDAQNELNFAKSNAKNAGLTIKSFEIDNQIDLNTIKEYATAEEEPNISPEPAYFISKKANQESYVVLQNALGLDELFYGYNYYHQAEKLQKIKPFLIPAFKYILKGSKKRKYSELTSLGLETIPFVSRSVSGWDEIKILFKNYNSSNWEHPVKKLMKQVTDTNTKFKDFPLIKKISYLDFFYYISSHHSVRSDIPAMNFKIEMRFPFLDHLFIQKYFNNTQTNENLTQGSNKPFLRKNVKNILPKDVLYMPKKGFSIPTNQWLKDVDLEKDFPILNTFFGDDYKKWGDTPEKKWYLISISFLKFNPKL